MTDYRAQVREAVQAAWVDSLAGFSWFGKYTRIPGGSDEARRARLLDALQYQLYSGFYQAGSPRPASAGAPPSGAAIRQAFAAQLSAANHGGGSWESGWIAGRSQDAEVEVTKDGLTIVVPLEACRAPGGVVAGAAVEVRFAKELRNASPGYYMALGERSPEPSTGAVLRFYFNVTPVGAVVAMDHLTARLNAERVPFRLKAIADPAAFGRCDPLVLYVPALDFARVRPELESLLPKLAPRCAPSVPPFTKPLAPGVAVAQDPGDGESFGLHRCRLLAEGIIRAYEAGAREIESRMAVVEAAFAAAGVSLDAPYGTSAGQIEVASSRPQARRPAPAPESPVPEPMDRAAAVAGWLCRSAVRQGERCTWLATPEGHAPGTTLVALGPDLYSGLAGVALFLAEYAAATGDEAACETALVAVNEALTTVHRIEPGDIAGLYTGRLGVALAAARIGTVLEQAELVERACELALSSLRDADGTRLENDLLAGRAGGIVALLGLRAITGETRLMEHACRLGRELLAHARRRRLGWSWASPRSPGEEHLTGFSHGAAGIGFALLELWAATGEAANREAAEHAFAYERYWYNAAARNWPDFREVRRRTIYPTTLPHAGYWCHGAPGIALSRLRASALLGEATYRHEAAAALETTARLAEAAITSDAGDPCLCHGLLGLAEVLRQGAAAAGDGARYTRLARRLEATAVANYSVKAASSPALMTGAAGVGHYFLKRARPGLPAVLMPLPENLAHHDASAGPPTSIRD